MGWGEGGADGVCCHIVATCVGSPQEDWEWSRDTVSS